MGMAVLYPDERAAGGDRFERTTLDDLLARADVVSLHCPLTDTTRGMIDTGALARMKPGGILINTARGALIDEAALCDALGAGRLAGFGADVLTTEPPPADHPLLSRPNVVVTPHTGALTRSTYTDSCVRSVRNVLAVLAGDDPEPGCVFNAGALAGAGR
jgi:D-3-phosphoglycerate dehydrogenase